jgi:hypothetical protein
MLPNKPRDLVAWRLCEACLGPRQGIKHQSRAFVIAHLALAEQHDQRPSLVIAYGMQFRVQAAFCAPDTAGNSPFLSRLAAVRCAFRWVASIISRSDLPALRASPAKILLNTPSLLHRTNRL